MNFFLLNLSYYTQVSFHNLFPNFQSLPTWPELQQARYHREKKMRRLRRLRKKEERARQREERKNVGLKSHCIFFILDVFTGS